MCFPLYFGLYFLNSASSSLSSPSKWFSVFLFLVKVHIPSFLACALLHVFPHVRITPAFSLWSSKKNYAADATFTDPLTCSFLILSFFVTSHIHLSIIYLLSPFLTIRCCPRLCTSTGASITTVLPNSACLILTPHI